MAGSIAPKLDFSGITNKAEVQASLVALNFDFSLWKTSPPKEYSTVAMAISELRKTSAEEGDLHKTARRLGALFDGVCPDSPSLIRAYGNRVSEICAKQNIDPTASQKHGMFSRHEGPDVGSIWAAATSGDNAIAVHLLACLIAEVFENQSEAVSLWTEFVARRKAEIELEIPRLTDQHKIESRRFAMQQEITRNDLQAWDNSARAWLRTAGEAKSREKQRAMLRVDTTGASINDITDPYRSVVQAWKDASSAMENLVRGIPQRVSNGAILLAMTAWQLYPDMSVPREGRHLVKQGDPLIDSAGILTIDLEARSEEAKGIHWSLPLSYMRYYGPPVKVTQRHAIDNSRITMQQFSFILLGCVVSQWYDFMLPVPKAISWMNKILDALNAPSRATTKNPDHCLRMQKITGRTSWVGQLLRAAENFAESDNDERETAAKLINHLGRRQPGFLCKVEHFPPPLFGLCEIAPLFRLLNGAEHRIKYLRALAKHWNLSNQNCVIQYTHTENNVSVKEWASIYPCEYIGSLLSEDGYLRRIPKANSRKNKYARWITVYYRGPSDSHGLSTSKERKLVKENVCKCKGGCSIPSRGVRTQPPNRRDKPESCPCWEKGGCSTACHDWKKTQTVCGTLHMGLFSARKTAIESMDEACFLVHSCLDPEDEDNGKFDFGVNTDLPLSLAEFSADKEKRSRPWKKAKEVVRSAVALELCGGYRELAAILRCESLINHGNLPTTIDVDPRRGRPGRDLKQKGEFLPEKVMAEVFDPAHFDYLQLANWFTEDLIKSHWKFTSALRACASTAEIFSCFGLNATIKASLPRHISLQDARWVPSRETGGSPLRLRLTRQQAFACIAMFETGGLNFDPAVLRDVFAMSSGDSIFVASPVVSDPFEEPAEMEIMRVAGNIGQPGLSFLIPPPEPMIKSDDDDESGWAVVNHHPFSGQLQPNFQMTSIHLLMTDFNPEVRESTDRGHYIEREACFRETVAQVFDGQKWVGDLDILSALRQQGLLYRARCTKSIRSASTKLIRSARPDNSNTLHDRPYDQVFEEGDMVQVDNWEELKAEPLDSYWAIVRASGQQAPSHDDVHEWLSRLAVAVIAVQLNRKTIILPDKGVCWDCVWKQLQLWVGEKVILVG